MIDNLNISEYLGKVDAELIPEVLTLIGAAGVTWAIQNLERQQTRDGQERTYNLESSITYSTDKEQHPTTGKTTGEPLQLADKNTVRIGSNVIYAAIHELGGTIYAKKKLGSVARKKEVWAMEQYFWHRYFQTKQEKWKFLALYMQEHNSVDIPAMPYLRPILIEHKDEIINLCKQVVNG